VLSSNGTVFASSGLDFPTALAFDSAGNLYAANVDNKTIEEFQSTGGMLSSNGTVFANSGLFAPYGLAFEEIPEVSTWAMGVIGLILLLSLRHRSDKV
jgi:hypothetical protein